VTDETFPATFRSRAARGVALGIVTIDLFVVGMAWRSLLADRNLEIEKAAQSVSDLAQVLGENLSGTLTQVDLALLAAQDALEEPEARSGGNWAHTEALVERTAERVPFLDSIGATTDEGVVVLGKGVDRAARVDVADRDYFGAAKRGPGRMVISSPLRSRVSGKESIILARAIRGPGGGTDGVVYAAVALESFTRTLSRVKLERGAAIVLHGARGSVMSRYPEPPGGQPIGRGERSPRLEAVLAAGLSEATFSDASPGSHEATLTAFRRVGGSPFYLLVSAPQGAFLEAWRLEAARTAAAVALFVLLSALAAWVLFGSMQRESEARFRALVDGAPIGITLVGDGAIRYVNGAFARTLRLPSARMALGRDPANAMPPADAARVRERLDRLLRGLPVEPTAEYTMLRPDGSRLRALVTDATVQLADGPAVLGFVEDVTERRLVDEERERLIAELKAALADVKTLSGLLPICAHCKKVRDDRGYWSLIETYIRERSSAEFTHGICPECARRFYGEPEDGDPEG